MNSSVNSKETQKLLEINGVDDHQDDNKTGPVDPWSLPELQIKGPKWHGEFFLSSR